MVSHMIYIYLKDRGDERGRPTWAGVVQAKMVGLQTTPVLHFPGVGLPSTHVVYSLHFSGSFNAMIAIRLHVGQVLREYFFIRGSLNMGQC